MIYYSFVSKLYFKRLVETFPHIFYRIYLILLFCSAHVTSTACLSILEDGLLLSSFFFLLLKAFFNVALVPRSSGTEDVVHCTDSKAR